MSNITLSSTFTDTLLEHSGTSLLDQILGGTLVIWANSGSNPAGPNESTNGTALATFTFDSTATDYSAPSGGVLNLKFSAGSGTATNPIVTASASGTAAYFRINTSGGTALIQGTVGTSGADFNLSSVAITSGDNVSITGTPSISWPVN
jgi:hypothetical protein